MNAIGLPPCDAYTAPQVVQIQTTGAGELRRSRYSMPPTSPTVIFVLHRTFLSAPLQGLAHRCKLRTSSCRDFCNACEDVTIIKESSVSRFADREFRLVEPNNVNVGGRSLEWESQMPVYRMSVMVASERGMQIPLAW